MPIETPSHTCVVMIVTGVKAVFSDPACAAAGADILSLKGDQREQQRLN
jgi:hypothetical protein